MNPAKIKVVSIGAICFFLLGGYNVVKIIYSLVNWANNVVVDFGRHSMACGKGVNEDYALIVGYHASKKKFNRDKPAYLLNKKVEVYYSPDNPFDSIISGKYGPQNYRVILFLIGSIVLFLFWLMRQKSRLVNLPQKQKLIPTLLLKKQ
mgnify:CR=1 FL=1|tara:strand:- start:10053 stop:10499 length:447 start_codon:yes stop_codon:yes gene_type:complete